MDVLKPEVDVTEPETGIDTETGRQLVRGLREAVANSYVLLIKTQACHWNVVGPLFVPIHTLTESQYRDLFDAVDALAERIRALGFPAPSSFEEMIAQATLHEFKGVERAEEMVRMLAEDHKKIARTFRDTAKRADTLDDLVTADMLIERMKVHEEAAWMLQSIIQT